MRISFPERVSPGKAIIFACVSFAVQQIEHTDPMFSALYFVFLLLSVAAFNIAGGFTRIAGAYYCWFSMLVCIVGVTWKAIIQEPAQTNLITPTLLLSCYDAAAAMFILVAIILKFVDARQYEFAATRTRRDFNYSAAGLGCIMMAIANNVAEWVFGVSQGGLLSALRQLDQFLPLGIILATIGAINDSNGKRTLNFANVFAMLLMFQAGLTTFSKQGMFTPLACWLIAVMYKKFDLQRSQMTVMAVVTFLCFYLLAPLSQSRDLLTERMTYSDRLLLGIDSILHPAKIRAHVKAYGDEPPTHSYYDKQQNALIGRLNMMGVDDALVHYGAYTQPLGISVVRDQFLNLVPHFITPNKAEPLTGNTYAHEIGGMLAEGDITTGISFSPVAEAFRVERYIGVFFILPAVWLLLFVSVEFICGDLKTSPWTLLPILASAHNAPEGLLSGQVYMIGFGNVAYLLCIVISTRLAPVLGALFMGSTRSQVGLTSSMSRPASDPAPLAA